MKKIVDIEQFRRKLAPATKAVGSNGSGSPPVKSNIALHGNAVDGQNAKHKKASATTMASPPAELPTQRLTKPAKDFRKRFLAALEEIKKEASRELRNAGTKADMKAKINVSMVLKRAKSSPLTAYSPLHRDILLPLVEQAAHDLEIAINEKFPKSAHARRDTLALAKEELSEAKASFEAQLSKLASQKLTAYFSGA